MSNANATQIPGDYRLAGEAVTLHADAPAPGAAAAADPVRRFDMDAYTGAPVDTFFGPMIVDLAGLDVGTIRKPILKQHDPTQIVGYSTAIEKTADGHLRLNGVVSSKTRAGQEVADLSDEGFPWQSSIGFAILATSAVKAGKSVTVNGREFAGPGVVVTKSRLQESSFVPLGADSQTSAVVLEGMSMTEDQIKALVSAQLAEAVKTIGAELKAGVNEAAAAAVSAAKAELSAAAATAATAAAKAEVEKAAVKLAGTSPATFVAEGDDKRNKDGGEDAFKKQFRSERAYELYKDAQTKGLVRAYAPGAPSAK